MAAGSCSSSGHVLVTAARSSLRQKLGKGKQRQITGAAAPAMMALQNFPATTAAATDSLACGVCSSRHTFSTSARTADVSAASTSSSPSAYVPQPSHSHAATSTPPSSIPRQSALIRPVRIVPSRLPAQIKTALNKKIRTHLPPVKPTVDERTAEVSKLYALQAVPPPTALSALATRISASLLGIQSDLSSKDKAEWLRKIEQCCTCPSFWQVIREEERQEEIRQYHQREAAAQAEGQQTALPDTSSEKKQYTNYLDEQRLHNEQLSTLGNHLLGLFTIEWLEARYPRLPTAALKAALTQYVGPRTCADVASKQWGILSGQAARQAFLGATSQHIPGQPLRGVGEGNRAGAGLLRWAKPSDADLKLLVSRQDPTVKPRDDSDHRTPLPLEDALASAARAFVGLIFQEHGFVAARQFVHANFLSRTADIAGLLKFSNPKYSLSSTLSKQGLAPPTTRILAETGRLSIAPIFVLGIYSGNLKLGEGYGSSLAMAEFRACEDALRRVYLSSQEKFEDIFMPIAITGKNGKKAFSAVKETESADGITGYPSDTIVNPSHKYEASRPLMDDEALYQSSGRSSVVSR